MKIEADFPKGGTRNTAPTPKGRHRRPQPTPTHIPVDRWYLVLTTPDGFNMKLPYDDITAREIAAHFRNTKVKAEVVLETQLVRR